MMSATFISTGVPSQCKLPFLTLASVSKKCYYNQKNIPQQSKTNIITIKKDIPAKLIVPLTSPNHFLWFSSVFPWFCFNFPWRSSICPRVFHGCASIFRGLPRFCHVFLQFSMAFIDFPLFGSVSMFSMVYPWCCSLNVVLHVCILQNMPFVNV